MTPVDISSCFLNPFYHFDQRPDPDAVMEENRQLREDLSAARVLIERQNQELQSLRGQTDCCSMQLPTTPMMISENETTSREGLQHCESGVASRISNRTSLPMEQSEIITAKVERVITRAFVRKAGKRFTVTPLQLSTRQYNGDESDGDTASTCSLSLGAQKDDDEHGVLDDSFVIGEMDTERPFEDSSAQTFNPIILRRGNAIAASKDRAAENSRIHSDVTTKVCNSATNAQDGPMHHLPPMPRRLASTLQPPIRQGAEILIHPIAMCLEVETHSLRDACQRKGTYSGSIDSRTLLPDGFGTMTYENEEYAGDWEQGYYHGYGKHTNAHGDVYDGPFHYGLKHGKENATMNFGDGRRFHGRFHTDKMREGVLHFIDGSWYEGLLENDKRHGFGLYCFVNGDEYEGQWKDDLMHGRGRMDWKSDATWYNGEWEFGIINGKGTKVDSNGNMVHQGYFYDGEPLILAEPMYEDGEYSDDDAPL